MSVKCILQGQQTHQIALEDVITIDDGAHITTEESMGEGPYTLEFTQEEELDIHISNENILHNSDFRSVINQKGQEQYTGTGYMIDRWRGQRPEIKLEIVPRGIKLSTESVSTARGIMQPLEENIVKELLGKTVTVSALVEEQSGVDGFFLGLYSALTTTAVTTGLVVASGQSGLITTTWQIPEELPSSHTHLNFYIGFQNTSAVNSGIIRAVKLELGSVQTLAHKEGDIWVLNDPPPDRALELAKCQRYQIECNPFNQIWSNLGFGTVRPNSTKGYLQIPLPTTLRIQPTVNYSGNWCFSPKQTAQTIIPITNMQVSGISGTICQLQFDIDSIISTTDAITGIIQNNNDTTAKLLLDANL